MGKNKKVVKRNSNGEIAAIFDSCTDAANSIGKNVYTMSRTILQKKEIEGHIYEYLEDENKEIDNSDKIKCPYCNMYYKTYNGLCKHIFKYKAHRGVTQEQLLTDVKYDGIRPTCKCGCGEYTTILYTGGVHFADYIQGHWNSVKNNWGHNPKAIEHSNKTRREQYANGTRIQWNKGKKWDETYNKEEQQRLRDNLINKLHERIEKSAFTISSNLEKDFIEKYIKPYNKGYKTQYYLPDIKQFCDIFIPELNLIIEINGSYWHCDRRIYNTGPINLIQEDKIKKDEIKYQFLNQHGYKLLVIWEYDIIHNPKKIEELIKRVLVVKHGWIEELQGFVIENNPKRDIIVKTMDLLLNSNLKPKKEEKTVYIFQDEWIYKKDIVKSRLLNTFGVTENKIYARKCYIKEITYIDASIFLDKNHLQGKISGCNYIGLFFNDKLVSLMVFGKLRKNLGSKNKEDEYELLRFCSVLNTNVIGAAGKLFQYFIKTYKPKKIISYCDKRWGEGEFYEKIGMIYSHDTQNNYFYVNDIDCKRENRFSYRKDILVNMGFDKNKSEKEIMEERGIRRIYDCGCKVFLWQNNIYLKDSLYE